MWASPQILGATAVRALTERAATHVLTIGTDKFTRADLARVGCYNYLAAATLSRVIKRDVAAKSVAHLYATFDPAAFLLPSIGPIALAVLGAAFELAGVGGDRPLEAWVSKHLAKDADIVTFDTLKMQQRKREAEQTTQRRRDTRAGGRRLHRLRDTKRGVSVNYLR